MVPYESSTKKECLFEWSLSLSGSAFQSMGAATEKALRP